MNRIKTMEKNRDRLLGQTEPSGLASTDPEFVAIRDRLIFGEIADKGTLDDRQRARIVIASLVASQAMTQLKIHAEAALTAGVTPVEIREVIYQTTPYTGFPRSGAAIELVNEIFDEHGVKIPLEPQGTANEESRFKDGVAVQKKIFGAENIDKMQASAPKGQQDIVTHYLSLFASGIFTHARG